MDAEDHSDGDLLDILAKVQLPTISLTDPVYEKGENLSDGEKQRLALARAMLRKESYGCWMSRRLRWTM